MNRKKIELILGSLTIVCAFFSWWSVAQILKVAGASSWTTSIIFFMLLWVFICLDIALFEDIVFLELLLFGSLLLGIIFTGSFWHIAGVFISGYFLFLASRKIRRDFELNVKIDFLKSLRSGKVLMILAISLAISAQYFSYVSQLNGQILIPRIETSGISGKIVPKILSLIEPNFKVLENENLTIDDLILQIQKSQSLNQDSQVTNSSIAQIVQQEMENQNISPNSREQFTAQVGNQLNTLNARIKNDEQAVIMKESRQQLSTLVGREVQGSEKASDVISQLIAKKIENIFTPNIIGKQRSSSIAIVLAGILFFTVFSIGSLLSVVSFLLSWMIFSNLVRFGLVVIKTVTVEKEVIF